MTLIQTSFRKAQGHRQPFDDARRELEGGLVDLLDALARRSDGDGYWLRSLARPSIDLESCANVDDELKPVILTGICHELAHVLSADSAGGGFHTRYARLRRASTELQMLHQRVTIACQQVADLLSAHFSGFAVGPALGGAVSGATGRAILAGDTEESPESRSRLYEIAEVWGSRPPRDHARGGEAHELP